MEEGLRFTGKQTNLTDELRKHIKQASISNKGGIINATHFGLID